MRAPEARAKKNRVKTHLFLLKYHIVQSLIKSFNFKDFPGLLYRFSGLFGGPDRFPGVFQDFQDSVRTLYILQLFL